MIFSNSPDLKDFVRSPFEIGLQTTKQAFLAAPYYTYPDPIIDALGNGVQIELLIGLNSATSPQAIRAVFNHPNVKIRYYTSKFHAKIFVFDTRAILGSANMTGGGLMANREAVIEFFEDTDGEIIDELRRLFNDLWDGAESLTDSTLCQFEENWKSFRSNAKEIEKQALKNIVESFPRNISVSSHKQSKERKFAASLHRLIYENYVPAFNEVASILLESNWLREDLGQYDIHTETNRFLNWVRLTYVRGDEIWQRAPKLLPNLRKAKINELGREWKFTDKPKFDPYFFDWLSTVSRVFKDEEDLRIASKEQLTDGLMSIHAFTEQLRFTKGGLSEVPKEFWKRNNNDVDRVRNTLLHLIHGKGDLVYRLHDVLYNQNFKLPMFAKFSALELMGTIRPDICAPMNGRIAKSLRFLGYEVPV